MAELRERARKLGLFALADDWGRYAAEPWLEALIEAEEATRKKRSLERRIKDAKLGAFKSVTDFDWSWPKKLDRELVAELFTLEFVREAANVVILGPNGLGKTMLAKNLAYQALLAGHSARFVTASEMLTELAAHDGAAARARCLHRYCGVGLLVIDEVGYLSYDNQYADLLYEVITRRYQQRSTVITTNRPFKEWNEVFPHAACVVTLVDRFMHRAEVVTIEGESFRLREAKERATAREKKRSSRAKSSE